MNIEFICPHCNEEIIVELPLPEDESYEVINFPCPKCVNAIGISKESLDECRLEKDVIKHPEVFRVDPTNASLAIPCPHCRRQFFIDLKILFDDLQRVLKSGKFVIRSTCPNCQKPISEVVPAVTTPQLLSPENPANLTPQEIEKLKTVFGHRFPKDDPGPPSPKVSTDPISDAEAAEFARELEESDIPPDSKLSGGQ